MPASPPTVATRLAFHPSRIVIDAGVLVTLGSMSVPFTAAAGASRSALAVGALPALILMAPIFAFTMIPDHGRPLPWPYALVSGLLATIAVPYSVVILLDAWVLAGTLGGSVGTGAWLLVAGTAIVALGVTMGLIRPNAFLRVAEPRARRAASNDESPFDGPLFDSLEIPVFVAGNPAPHGAETDDRSDDAGDGRGPTLVFEADRAAGRIADDADDGIRSG